MVLSRKRLVLGKLYILLIRYIFEDIIADRQFDCRPPRTRTPACRQAGNWG